MADNLILLKNLQEPKKALIPKPILKWVGGKTQILGKLLEDFPTNIENYHEIFLGGGSVLFALLAHVKVGNITITGQIYASDLNGPLISMYKNIQGNYENLYNEIQILIVEFLVCNADGIIIKKPQTIEDAKTSKESYYYWIRGKYNGMNANEKLSLKGSAMFIFLNKTCFRGMFRTGPNGFNVPYGHYAKPEIINKEHLKIIHDLIQNVIFECNDFSVSLQRVGANDFAYLDPPYAPENVGSFVGYTEEGFSLDKHNSLFALCNNLTNQNKKIMMSNADVKLVREQFVNNKFIIESIICKRSINSKNPNAKTKEVIIRNYYRDFFENGTAKAPILIKPHRAHFNTRWSLVLV